MPVASSPPSPAHASEAVALRFAEPEDVDPLLRLETAAFSSDRLSRRRLAAFVRSPSSDLLVAEADGTIAGYALVLRRAGSGVARLYSLAIDPNWRGQGIARRLLAEVELAAARRGAAVLRLEVRADNPAAIGLYEARGYAPIGRREDYYQDGAAGLRFEKALTLPPGRGASPAATAQAASLP